jgi:hypothetical protein
MVIHVFKDGSRPTDITGHIVRLEDVSPLYQLIHSINQKKTNVKTQVKKRGKDYA